MIYRLHCHSIVGCEESPVTAVAGAGLPAGGFVSVTGSLCFQFSSLYSCVPFYISVILSIRIRILAIYRIFPVEFMHPKDRNKNYLHVIQRNMH